MSTVGKKYPSRTDFKGFLNIELTEADKQDFDYWGEGNTDTLYTALTTLIGANFKVGISWNDWADAYQFAITCKDVESKYCGYCIVITHESAMQGLIVLKHLYEKDLVTEKLLLENDQLPIPID